MAITSGAGPGIVVTSAAKNGALGDQSAGGSDQIIFDTNINTNNGNLEASPTFVGRLVVIRRGAANEETRYITAIDGDGVTATVHENWVTPPASGDTYHVSYMIQDAATVQGLTLVTKTNIYESNRRLTIGDGTAFAFFALVDGQGFELRDDNVDPAVTVANNGRFDNGYLFSSRAVAAGFMFGIQNGDGEDIYQFNSGSEVRWYDTVVRSALASLEITQNSQSRVEVQTAKFFDCAYDCDIPGGSWKDITFEGRKTSTETVLINSGTVIDNWRLISTAGFTTANDSVAETLEIKNVQFVGNSANINVFNEKTWNVVNPIWTINTGTQNELLFGSNNTNNSVNEQFEFIQTYAQADGTSITGTISYVYEGLNSQSIRPVNTQASDVNGKVSSSITKNTYTSGTGGLDVQAFGDFAHKAYNYGFSPFVGALTVNQKIDATTTLTTDSALSSSLSGTALSLGTGSIDIFRHTTSPVLGIDYDDGLGGGNTAFVVGEFITGSTSQASGTIIEAGTDANDGFLIISGVQGTFQDNEIVDGSIAGRVTTDLASRNQNFTWEIFASGSTMQITYDYLAAKMAENPVDTKYQEAIEWGEEEQSQLFYFGPNGFFTERNINLTEGVYVSSRGAGTIDKLTADDGTTFTPPTSVTLEVNGVSSGARVYIVANSGGPEAEGAVLMLEEADGTGTASEPYNFTTNQPVTVRARLKGFLPFETTSTITSAGLTITAIWLADSNFGIDPKAL